MSRLIKLIKRAIHIITRSKYNAHTLFKQLNLLNNKRHIFSEYIEIVLNSRGVIVGGLEVLEFKGWVIMATYFVRFYCKAIDRP